MFLLKISSINNGVLFFRLSETALIIPLAAFFMSFKASACGSNIIPNADKNSLYASEVLFKVLKVLASISDNL